MVLRIVLIMCLALPVLGIGIIGMHLLRGPATAEAPVEATPVSRSMLVATRNIRAGTLIKPDDLEAKDLPAASLPAGISGFGAADRNGLQGAMVRRSVSAGEPLMVPDVLRPGDHGFLAAVLGPGMRAVSVGVDAVRGSSGLIWPGDRVDLVLTQQLDQDVPLAKRVVGETVLADVRVIAIDQNLMQGAMDNADLRGQARTVTLEVTPLQGERVAVASRLGTLSLAVRSAVRSSEPETATAAPDKTQTWGGDVSPALGAVHGGAVSMQPTVRVWQGATKSEEVKF